MTDCFRAGKRLWSRADERILRARFPHEPSATVARDLRRSLSAISQRARILGLKKTAAYLASPAACRLRRLGDDHPGKATQFQKGHVPANKGNNLLNTYQQGEHYTPACHPGRLWSLWEMVKPFVFSDFGAHLVNLERATAALEIVLKPVAHDPKFHESIIRGAIPNMSAAVQGLLTVSDKGDLPLSHPVVSQIADLMNRLDDFDSSEAAAVAENARLTRQAILNDLSQHLFFCVEGVSASQFEDDEPWGGAVKTTYPGASKDIAASRRCLALREWTACIFHCMRALEHGLAQIAERFSVSFKTESWHRVINDIEKAIESLREKSPLTEQDHKDITHYSEAAKEFRYFKDAWRNHVSHGREWYDDRDAHKVYDHVRDFMQQLATSI